MDERLSDLLARLRQRFAGDPPAAEVEAILAAEGYDRRQIGEILALLAREVPRSSEHRRQVVQLPTSFRVLGPHERGRFAPEAWGHLLSLNAAGLLNGVELEHVIDRALMHIDGRIALDDLRSLLEGTGFDEAGPSSDQATVH